MRGRSKRGQSRRTPAADYFQAGPNSDQQSQEAGQMQGEEVVDQHSLDNGVVDNGQVDVSGNEGLGQVENGREANSDELVMEEAEVERINWGDRIDPEVPAGQDPDQVDMDGWELIDRTGGWEAFL